MVIRTNKKIESRFGRIDGWNDNELLPTTMTKKMTTKIGPPYWTIFLDDMEINIIPKKAERYPWDLPKDAHYSGPSTDFYLSYKRKLQRMNYVGGVSPYNNPNMFVGPLKIDDDTEVQVWFDAANPRNSEVKVIKYE